MALRSVAYAEDLSFPWAAFRAELAQKPRICMICNPNNPTSTLVPSSELLGLAREFPATLFVVDEIYEPFTRESVLPDATLLPNVLALRSLSKATGLAALRLGFACGSAPLVERVFRVRDGAHDHARDLRAGLVITERRAGRQKSATRLAEGVKHGSNGGIGPVERGDLLALHAEVVRKCILQPRVLGIGRIGLCRQGPDGLQDARARPERVLVEVEAEQTATAFQRRHVALQRFDARTCLNHVRRIAHGGPRNEQGPRPNFRITLQRGDCSRLWRRKKGTRRQAEREGYQGEFRHMETSTKPHA
jgi:hypothetical protein